jgi:C-terminal processing protease CtpA/Prc
VSRLLRPGLTALVVLLVISFGGTGGLTQTIDSDRDQARRMLRTIKKELERRYYDPGFGGLDLEALFERASGEVASAESEVQLSGILVKTLLELDDSHTFFIPPPTPYQVDYGFEMAMVGDRCLVVGVKPGSLAAEDGLAPGCAVRMIEGVRPTRENLWSIDYALHLARPREKLHMVVECPGNAAAERVVRARVSPARQYQDITEWVESIASRQRMGGVSPLRTRSIGDGLIAAQLSTFLVDESVIDDAMERIRGRDALILDLRGNAGGSIEILRHLVGYLFDRDIVIGRRITRKKTEPVKAKRRSGKDVFSGPLVVLIDSRSASAAEAMARVIQLEKRGIVLGDRSAGAVMEARQRSYRQGHRYRFLLYGLSITEADLVMRDGGRLEKVGVSPDEVVLPTPEDLAAGRDPVLARAADTLGEALDPVAAGRMFPRQWQ